VVSRVSLSVVLGAYGMSRNAPLSAMAVEVIGQRDEVAMPLRGHLGGQRILRAGCLARVPQLY